LGSTPYLCELQKNDIVDIKCGGPAFLGFDFNVDPEKKNEMIKFIQKCLKDNNIPCISTHASGMAIVNKVWSKERIKKCIEEYVI